LLYLGIHLKWKFNTLTRYLPKNSETFPWVAQKAARPDAARPTRSVQARKRPQTEGDALGGGPTKVFRLNPAPLRVLGRRRRGGDVRGAWEEGSIAPVPSSPAQVLGDHPRRMLH
jgi:hypothetical protein